ncbi:MAG: hypothetical protein M3140_10515 [Actinomycetota bacterium]|nr:hypothetical protein [Actinomycetota bacterium]
MSRSLADEVLGVLETSTVSEPITLSDLARRFGVSGALMTSCARQIVAEGRAEPAMASHRGVPALHGLLPRRT